MQLARGLGRGLVGGAVGLVAMELVRRATKPLVVARKRRPADVFYRERSMSPLGPQHRPGESSTAALGRIGYERLAGHPPPPRARGALSWLVHIAYGLVVAAGYGAIRAGRTGPPLRDGALFGAGLWLAGDEVAVPLLGLADKPTAYHPTRHFQSLAQHLGFGVATAATARLLEHHR